MWGCWGCGDVGGWGVGTWVSKVFKGVKRELGIKSCCFRFEKWLSDNVTRRFRARAATKRPRADLDRDRWIQSPEC